VFGIYIQIMRVKVAKRCAGGMFVVVLLALDVSDQGSMTGVGHDVRAQTCRKEQRLHSEESPTIATSHPSLYTTAPSKDTSFALDRLHLRIHCLIRHTPLI
jgi:hypothetical protein